MNSKKVKYSFLIYALISPLIFFGALLIAHLAGLKKANMGLEFFQNAPFPLNEVILLSLVGTILLSPLCLLAFLGTCIGAFISSKSSSRTTGPADSQVSRTQPDKHQANLLIREPRTTPKKKDK